jgi:hypothetical protein
LASTRRPPTAGNQPGKTSPHRLTRPTVRQAAVKETTDSDATYALSPLLWKQA